MADSSYEMGDELFVKLKGWFIQDRDARSDWAKEAEIDFGWSAPGGEMQWDQADRDRLKTAQRPCITFNRILPVIQAVSGMEVNDRKEVKFLPRTTQNEPQPEVDPLTGGPVAPAGGNVGVGADDQGPAETLSAAAEYLRDQCDAEDEESDAFQDTVTCGMGWVETRVDYEENPDGDLREDRLDPLEMVWDGKATKRNLIDARRVWRVREVDKEEAQRMFPDRDLAEIDAGWARMAEHKQPHDREAARNYESGAEFDHTRQTITIVEGQYWEYKTAYKAALGDEVSDVDAKQLKTLKANARTAGVNLSISKHNKRVIYTCILGSVLLERAEAQSQECFKYQAITGYRDRNAKQWVGLVRAMRDPQRWANALMSSVLHQIQVSGKGVIAEKDAFDNWQEAERQWANGAKIVMAKTGALGQHPKIKQKEQNNIPSGTLEMMEFSLSAFRDVTGVNVEAMGLADRTQAASLEYQRRQAASTILAPFFDGMRRFRKDNGRLVLDLIRQYLSDDRLVRIVGPDYTKYVPLTKQEDTLEYDIIVDESASSPNQKEASWQILQTMLPVMADKLTPGTMGVLMKASPLPTSLVNEFKESAEADAQNAGPSPDEIKLQMQGQQMQFDMAQGQQKSQLDQAKMQADLQIKSVDLQIALATLEQAKLKTAADFQMAQINAQGAVQQREHDGVALQMKMQGDAMTRDAEMQRMRMEMEAADSKETMNMFGKDFPAQLQQIMQSNAETNQALADALQALAQAMLAPRVTEMPDPVTGQTMRAVSSVHSNGMVN